MNVVNRFAEIKAKINVRDDKIDEVAAQLVLAESIAYLFASTTLSIDIGTGRHTEPVRVEHSAR